VRSSELPLPALRLRRQMQATDVRGRPGGGLGCPGWCSSWCGRSSSAAPRGSIVALRDSIPHRRFHTSMMRFVLWPRGSPMRLAICPWLASGSSGGLLPAPLLPIAPPGSALPSLPELRTHCRPPFRLHLATSEREKCTDEKQLERSEREHTACQSGYLPPQQQPLLRSRGTPSCGKR
jgi:hypothetical protein